MLRDPIITVNVTLATQEAVLAFFTALNGTPQAELPIELSTVQIAHQQPVAATPAPAPVITPPPTAVAVPVTAVPVITAQPIQQEPGIAPAAVPTSAPEYTFDALARAAAPLMDAGRTADLQALLRSFNVQALTQLPKEQYGAFATGLRGLGARV